MTFNIVVRQNSNY